MRKGDNVILVGMPGVGKTTIGVLLAERLGFGFLDTDILIQNHTGLQLQQIIAIRGPAVFRQIEEKTILRLSVRSSVIATGGSVVYSHKAMQHLRHCGWVCHLDLAPQLLMERLGNIDTRGIVMSPGQTIESLYRERDPLYRQHADFTIATDRLAPNQVLRKVHSAFAAFTR